MKLEPTRKNIVTIVFLAMTLTSIGYIVFEAYNYDNFYWSAVGQINSLQTMGIDSATVTNSTSTPGNLILQLRAHISNPTNYKGLWVSYLTLTVSFADSTNDTLFQQTPLLATTYPETPLNPQSTVNSTFTLALAPPQSTAYLQFSKSASGRVLADVRLTIILDTFLDPVTGVLNPLKEQLIPIT